MCDNIAMWNTNFYHQYLQQHARMTQWIQNLHQNFPQHLMSHETQTGYHHNHYQQQGLPHPWQNFTSNDALTGCHHNHFQHQALPLMQPRHCIPQPEHYVPPQGCNVQQSGLHVPPQGDFIPEQGQHDRNQRRLFRQQRNSKHNSDYNPRHRSRSQTSAEFAGDNEIDAQENNEDDGELVLNIDAILAFRAAKEESEKEEDAVSEESFELVDTVLDENFEFVELDDAGQLQKVIGRRIAPDAKGGFEYDRESRIVLFGDKADRIAGLETSLEIMFDHINDLHQPVVYPHM